MFGVDEKSVDRRYVDGTRSDHQCQCIFFPNEKQNPSDAIEPLSIKDAFPQIPEFPTQCRGPAASSCSSQVVACFFPTGRSCVQIDHVGNCLNCWVSYQQNCSSVEIVDFGFRILRTIASFVQKHSRHLALGVPDGLEETIALGKAVEGVVRLAHGANEAGESVDDVLALDGTAVLVDLGDGDLARTVVLGLDDAARRRALAGDVTRREFPSLAFHLTERIKKNQHGDGIQVDNFAAIVLHFGCLWGC